MRNYKELQNDVAVLCQRAEDADYKAKIAVWLNMEQKFLAEIYDYWIELQDIYNFNATDGKENYGLPNRFDKPLRLYNLTSKAPIHPKTEEQYFDENISNIADASEGQPSSYRIFGVQGLTTNVSATTGSIIKVKSSSSSDTGSIIIQVRGYVDASFLIEDYEEITISSGTPTTYVSGTKTFFKVTQVGKSANTVGYITLANSASDILEYISPNERVVRHKVLKLGLIPDATYSMRLLFKKTIFEMVQDNDYPFAECDRYLTLATFGWALKQDTKDAQAEYVWNQAKEAMNALLLNQNSKLGPDYQHKLVSAFMEAHRR